MAEMSQEEMLKILKSRGKDLENFFQAYESDYPEAPPRLKEAMFYSLNAGGKRLRPVLCMSCASLCRMDIAKVLPFSAAIEMIHTYSLIHDDLPAMDNDDLRRGKPSNHKAFGEATAILAGDALLTDAFWLMSRTKLPANHVLNAIGKFAEASGSAGMAGGQMLDMQYTGQTTATLEEVRKMQAMKTGAILEASCVCGAMLAGAQIKQLKYISNYGKAIGRAFQIVDDILDITGNEEQLGKPVGSDQAAGKNTIPALIGIEKSRELADAEVENAKKALNDFSGAEADFLRALAEYIQLRAS